MKILKIFGIVVGIHVFALILIFANPGCSTSTKTAAKPADLVAQTEPGASVALPTNISLNYGSSTESPVASAPLGGESAAPISFNPEIAASTGVRYSPTRPNTPAASTLQSAPVTDVVPASTYSVTKGDSLWSVAKKNHLTVAELADANNLAAGATLRLGQKLIIPGKAGNNANPVNTAAATAAAVPFEATAPKPTTESVTHIVKPGETLGAIARKYQVSVGEVATANNITDPAKIRPGRELIIPGWKGTGAKPSATKSATAASTPVESKPVAPIFTLPPPGQDLDQGLKPTSDAPVIKVEEASPFSPN
jgi:LysM repeat protein